MRDLARSLSKLQIETEAQRPALVQIRDINITVKIENSFLERVRTFSSNARTHLADLAPDAQTELSEALDAIDRETASPTPDRGAIQKMLGGVFRGLAGVGSGIAAEALWDQFQNLLAP